MSLDPLERRGMSGEMITKLEGISVKNFRGIRETTIRGFSDINVFIGRNGSGKSTLLEAIYLASSFIEKMDPLISQLKINVITRRRVERDMKVNREILWYGLETGNPIQLTLFFTSDKEMNLELYAWEREGRLIMNLDMISEITARIPRDRYTHFNYSDSVLININTKVYATDATLKNYFFKIFEGEINLLSNVTFIDERTLRHPEIMERKIWPKILSKRLDKRIIEIVRRAMRNVQRICHIFQ